MDKFLMICYVAADFGPYEGLMFSVKPSQIGTFIEAPGWIKNTLLYKWLLKDGSIKVAVEGITMKQGENDPMKDISASGKDIKVAEAAEAKTVAEVDKEAGTVAEVDKEEETAEAEKPKRRRTKKDDAK